MRLTLKLLAAFVIGNTILATIYGYFAIRHEARMFQDMTRDEAAAFAVAMRGSLNEAWRETGARGVVQWVQRANAGHTPQLRIRWVWFDTDPGDPDAPLAARTGLTTLIIEQHLTIETLDPDGTPYMHVYWPVELPDPRRGGLEVSHVLTELQRSEQETMLHTGLWIAGMAALSGLLAAVLGLRYVGRPLRALIAKTQRVARGDLAGPLVLRSHDELEELAAGLNRMCHELAQSQLQLREETATRIAALEQLRHADRLKTVGRLAAGIAHELGTPLAVVSGRAGLIESGRLPPADVRSSATAIRGEAERMTHIIRQLLDFARVSTPRKACVDLRQLVRQTVDLLQSIGEKHHVHWQVSDGPEPVTAEVDSSQMQQVLTNLLVNAAQAMPQGGAVEINVSRQLAAPPGESCTRPRPCAAIAIRDRGVGIAEEHLRRLFEPFFTTKDVGEGTGLGLSIAYGIVAEHGGWIDVASRPGEGSCFTVLLPQEPAA